MSVIVCIHERIKLIAKQISIPFLRISAHIIRDDDSVYNIDCTVWPATAHTWMAQVRSLDYLRLLLLQLYQWRIALTVGVTARVDYHVHFEAFECIANLRVRQPRHISIVPCTDFLYELQEQGSSRSIFGCIENDYNISLAEPAQRRIEQKQGCMVVIPFTTIKPHSQSSTLSTLGILSWGLDLWAQRATWSFKCTHQNPLRVPRRLAISGFCFGSSLSFISLHSAFINIPEAIMQLACLLNLLGIEQTERGQLIRTCAWKHLVYQLVL